MDDIKLKPLKSQSMKSVKSMRGKSVTDCNILEDKPLELDDFIAIACKKFPCPWKIVVKKEAQVDEVAKVMKQESLVRYKRISVAPAHAQRAPTPTPESEKETDETVSRTTSVDENAIIITAYYDAANRVAEIHLHKINVPRMLIQILGLILPHYQNLTKMVLKRCRITAYTIYEMNKFIPLSTITDISFDDSPVPQGNYALLLDNHSKIASLSLCRCNINDDVCRQIASKLHNLEPAEATLTSLNLSSNRITDVGAKYLGEALRTNRHLRYLNLADNRIGDEGANHIFNALTDFLLTYDDIMDRRLRLMAHLRSKHAIYLKYLAESDSRSLDDFSMYSKKSSKKTPPLSSLKSKAKRDKMKSSATVDDYAQVRAEMMVNDLIGPFVDPFMPSFTRFVNGYHHCIGNMILCYLNLNYNNLSYLSLKKLQSVLFYQSVNKKNTQTGLLRVLIDGNKLPVCNETERISEMLHRNVMNFSPKYSLNKLKARARISVIPERNTK